MRYRESGQKWLGIGLTLLSVVGNSMMLGMSGAIAGLEAASAQAATLTAWRFNPSTNQLEVTVPEGVAPRYFILAQPPRIVLDLPNTDVGTVPEMENYSGLVRQVRVGQFQPGLTRIVIELSPDATFAPGQVELQPANAPGGDRWVLRPLLTDGPSVAVAAPSSSAPSLPAVPPVAPATTTLPLEQAPLSEEPPPTSTARTVQGTVIEETHILPRRQSATVTPAVPSLPTEQNPEQSPNLPDTTAPPRTPAIAPPPLAAPSPPGEPADADGFADLPPLEPNATQIPVEVAPGSEVRSPSPPDSLASAPTPPADEVTTLPPATFSDNAPVSVQVPPLRRDRQERPEPPAPNPSSSSVPPSVAEPPTRPESVPPPAPPASPSMPPPTVESPTRPESTPGPAASEPPPAERQFPAAALTPSDLDLPPDNATPLPPSQRPLPLLSPSPLPAPATPPPAQQDVAVAPTSPILIPTGTVLNLRYPRDRALALQEGAPWQEVLLLDQAVEDATGTVVVPAGSQVIGRFETTSEGSHFVAQAIILQEQNVRLNAQSDVLRGDRQVSDNHVLRNSALGGAALMVLGAFTGVGALLGVITGAAAGAATTYLTAPQPAMIQPNQIIEVRLTEDLPGRF